MRPARICPCTAGLYHTLRKEKLTATRPYHCPYFFVQLNARKPFCHQTPPAFAPAYAGLPRLRQTLRFFTPVFLSLHFYQLPIQTIYPPNAAHPRLPRRAFPHFPQRKHISTHIANKRTSCACPCLSRASQTATPRFLRTHFFIYGIITNRFLNQYAIKHSSPVLAPSGFPENCPLHS